MRDTKSYSLYIALIEYIAQMQKEIESTPNSKRWKRKQYPAVTVGAECQGYEHIGNHHGNARCKDFEPLLLNALHHNYRCLNSKDVQSGNYVGHCAENYAATEAFLCTHALHLRFLQRKEKELWHTVRQRFLYSSFVY